MIYKIPSLQVPVELRVIMADVVGYVIVESSYSNPGTFCRTLAAFTTAEEAAEFIKNVMGRPVVTVEAAE
jgi:hypothetical protein